MQLHISQISVKHKKKYYFKKINNYNEILLHYQQKEYI